MFTIIIIVIGLLITFLLAKKALVPNQEKISNKYLSLAIFSLICTIFLIFINPFKLIKTDSAEVGLKVNILGNDRGVQDYTVVTGRNVINTWTEDYFSYPKNIQTVKYAKVTTFSKGGFPVDIKPTFTYKLVPSNVGDMFINLRQPLEHVHENWLNTELTNAINEVINKYSVDYIFNNREIVEKEIETKAKSKVGKWFTVQSFKTNLTPPASLQNAVIKEAQAIKDAQAEVQNAFRAEAAGKTLIAEAKADSANIVIRANAEAVANRLKEKSLTPMLLKQMEIEKWDGNLPTYMGNNIPFILNK